MQMQILSGIYTSGQDYRTAYPVNMVPKPKATGISEGLLRVAPGIVKLGEADGACRGGAMWRGKEYRVFGSHFYRVSGGTLTDYGHVGTGGPVKMAASFDYLAINSGNRVWLFNGQKLQEITDKDRGDIRGITWIDGYFAMTDGEYIVITELNDPFSIDPLEYGSSEVSPDEIMSILNVRNELTAVNRYTIETFYNAGTENFPFARNNGAHVTKGAVGPSACCVMNDTIAILGSGENEPLAVYQCSNGAAVKISSAEVDRVLKGYDDLSEAVLEFVADETRQTLLIHLPDRTLAYDAGATATLGVAVWYILNSHQVVDEYGAYQARYHLWHGSRWTCASPDTGNFGYLSDDIATHYGARVWWGLTTPMIYSESKGAIMHELELVGIFGGGNVGSQYSLDGVTWSNPRFVTAGAIGAQNFRLRWLGGTPLRSSRTQRFIGWSDTVASVSRLEARVEPLAW